MLVSWTPHPKKALTTEAFKSTFKTRPENFTDGSQLHPKGQTALRPRLLCVPVEQTQSAFIAYSSHQFSRGPYFSGQPSIMERQPILVFVSSQPSAFRLPAHRKPTKLTIYRVARVCLGAAVRSLRHPPLQLERHPSAGRCMSGLSCLGQSSGRRNFCLCQRLCSSVAQPAF